MTLTGAGRHCAACDKVVVDFTRMTDGELVAWFEQRQEQRSCGRFTAYQVGRPLLPAPESAPAWRRWALAMVALLGLGSNVRAQTGGHHRNAAIQVVDVQTGLPIAGARVVIHDGHRLRSALTDSSGCVWKSAPHWWKVDVLHPDYYQTRGRAVAPYQAALAGSVIRRIALEPFEVEVAAATITQVEHFVGIAESATLSCAYIVRPPLSKRLFYRVRDGVRKIFRRHRTQEME